MRLTNDFKVTKITKRTNAELFKDIKIGDILRISLALGDKITLGSATYLKVTNLTQGTSRIISYNNFIRLQCFELERE